MRTLEGDFDPTDGGGSLDPWSPKQEAKVTQTWEERLAELEAQGGYTGDGK